MFGSSPFRFFCRLSVWVISLLLTIPLRAERIVVSVESYNSAVVEGDDADELYISYIQKQNTPYKCRLSKGDSAILRIEGLPEATISSISLSMRSNRTSGAGSLQMRIGGQTVWQIADASFASDSWYGSYSDTYVAVSHSLNCPSGTLEMIIVSSVNSLYFSSLSIDFSPVTPSPHTVTLDCGTGALYWLSEQTAGAGVTLPLPDYVNSDWRPIGWTEIPLSQQTECPVYFRPGDRFYPARDMRLYALYRSENGLQMIAPDSSFRSGEYVLAAGNQYYLVANGSVNHAAVPMASCEMEDGLLLADHAAPSCRYLLTFEGDSVLIRHEATSSWLGHSASALSNTYSRWAWQPAAGGSICFSFGTGNRAMCLLPRDEQMVLYALADNDPARYEHLFLFPTASLPLEPQTIVYTSYPLCGVGLPELPADSGSDTPRAEKRFIDGRIVILLPDGRRYDLLAH